MQTLVYKTKGQSFHSSGRFSRRLLIKYIHPSHMCLVTNFSNFSDHCEVTLYENKTNRDVGHFFFLLSKAKAFFGLW